MIAIIQYNAGNVLSVSNAIERLGYECCVTDNAKEIEKADKIILPGVGAAGMAMAYLNEKKLSGLIQKMEQPVLGICLGLQLMCQYSEEDNTTCMGIFHSVVKKIPQLDLVPHMGWNNLTDMQGNLFKNIGETDDVYFVHSYAASLSEATVAVCDYVQPFSAALNKDNFYATQFHPEKSALVGEQILKNFLAL